MTNEDNNPVEAASGLNDRLGQPYATEIAYAGPTIFANSFEEAEQVAKSMGCKILGKLEHVHYQDPL